MAFDTGPEDAEAFRISRGEAMQRARRRRWERRKEQMATRVTRAGGAGLATLLGMIVWGFAIGPLGVGGVLLGILLGLVGMVTGMALPVGGSSDDADGLDKLPPAELPARTDAWLDRQRRQLPRTAGPALDAISARLTSLERQLAQVPENHVVAQDVARLLSRHLPELVERYLRVPPEQRAAVVESDGRSLDASLIDGLNAVEKELARASASLAEADRAAVRVQGKFLEAKAQDAG
jgi:hypothetical protein